MEERREGREGQRNERRVGDRKEENGDRLYCFSFNINLVLACVYHTYICTHIYHPSPQTDMYPQYTHTCTCTPTHTCTVCTCEHRL